MQIERAAVVGLGTMGAGIAEVLASAGLAVIGIEVDEAVLEAGRRRLNGSLDRAVERGRLDADQRTAIADRLSFATDRTALAEVDLVVEAVPERLDIKTALFTELHGICPAHTVFATNTSSLPVTAIAAASGRPDRVVGMHFFNPAPVMRLVEVVSTLLASTNAVDAVTDLARRCGKTPVVVGDRAGFIANTLLVGYLGHAARLVDARVAAVADIDAAITASCGLPMGPLRLLDLIGLDVTVEILRVLDEEFASPRYRVAPLLRRLTLAGQLGIKSGHGFYAYEGREATPAVDSGPLADVLADGASSQVRVSVAPGDDPETVSAALGGLPVEAPGKAPVAVHVPRAPRSAPVVEVVVPDLGAGSPPSELIAAVAAVRRQAEAAGRTVVVCKDRPGYVVEALLYEQLNDAAAMVGDGYASVDDVDTAMTLGCGYPAGPFAMLREVGAATVAAAVADPAPLLRELAQ